MSNGMESILKNDILIKKNKSSSSGAQFLSDIRNIREPLLIVENKQNNLRNIRLYTPNERLSEDTSMIGILPAIYPEWLGDRNFLHSNGLIFPYIAGEMARGISSVDMVIEMGKAGMLGIFGAGGLPLSKIEDAINTIQKALSHNQPWGINLIHSPQRPELELAMVDLCLKYKVRCLSASAFMALSPTVVHYAFKGIHIDNKGNVIRPNRVFAKISRAEVALQFMSPPSEQLLTTLVNSGALTKEEAVLASRLPVAENITVEADSGGHTDSRALSVLLPVILNLRDELRKKYNYDCLIHVGAAGGIATPSSVAAAFSYGAAYVVTGSINQSAVESGIAKSSKAMLANLSMTDVALAPAGDMFELGAKVQVAKKGTLFPQRANKLYELYCQYDSLSNIPKNVQESLERDVFKMTFDEVWGLCKQRLMSRDTKEVDRANRDPRHKMALIFRWYLGASSRWCIDGEEQRKMDYQLWCGPAMGAFNDWVKGSFLEDINNRTVVQIALNLLEGASIITRTQQCRNYGLIVPDEAYRFKPRLLK